MRIATQGEFQRGLTAALADSSRLYVMNVLLDPADRSAGMVRLAHRLLHTAHGVVRTAAS